MERDYANLKIQERQDSLSKKIVVSIDYENLDDFQLNMILSNCPSIVKANVEKGVDKVILEYDVSNYICIEKLLNVKKSPSELIEIILDIIDIVNQSKNHYLDHSLLLIDKRYMFYDSMKSEVMLIYLPLVKYPKVDILQLIKSELFKDASDIYCADEYSLLFYTIMSASTLASLKHSLINLESKLYEKKEVEIYKRDESTKEHVKESKAKIDKDILVKSSHIKKTDKLEKRLKYIVIAVITILILLISIFIAISLKLPLVSNIIIASVLSLLIPMLLSKVLLKNDKKFSKKSTMVKKVDRINEDEKSLSSEKAISLDRELYFEVGTVLVSDLENKDRLINLESGEAYILNFTNAKVMSLGRASSSDIHIDDNSIGRNHSSLIKKSDQIYICDNNSLNGTFINEIQLKPLKNYMINSGDVIYVGKAKLKLDTI